VSKIQTTLNSSLRGSVLGLAAFGALALAAPAAWAGCADGAAVAPASWHKGEADARLIRVNLGEKGIVGLWSFSFVAPNGTQVDWGYTEWHSDGTEITNSGGHSPASGNFCLGVWRQTGPNTYHLKHYPLAYDPATGLLANKIVLTEDVTVDSSGDNFSGAFTTDVYDANGKFLVEAHGTVTGHRIEPN
jgi:hypothetical protein